MRKKSIALFVIICGIFTCYSCNLIIAKNSENRTYYDHTEVPFSEYSLVLGTVKEVNGHINPYFKYRMEAAADLFFAGKTKKIIVSGDNNSCDYDETTDMMDHLIELGVPKSAIICDYAGFRTLDSVLRAKKVFNCKKLIIVSQKFHNERALYIADHAGIEAVGYNARDIGHGTDFTHGREYLARLAVFIDLYYLNTQPKFPS